jgi:hypothetical protein
MGTFTQTSGSANLGTNFTVAGAVRINAGNFAGRGNVAGSLFNSGTASPGSPLGLIAGSSWTNNNAGTFKVELGGTSGGTNYDQVRLTAPAMLDGPLDISLVNGFVPATGNQFTVMVFTARSGMFSATNSPYYDFSVLYTSTNVILRAENARPVALVNTPTNPFVCLPFKISAIVNDTDGAVTNLDLLVGGQVVGSFVNSNLVNPFITSLTLSYDYPGSTTVGLRATDERGGVTLTNVAVEFLAAPIEVITPCGFQPNQSFKVAMVGQTGVAYQLLANSNLVTTNWVSLGTMENTNGIWRFSDARATNHLQRYYRARLQE